MRKRRKIETIIVIILILLLFLIAFTILNKHKIKNSNLLNTRNINAVNKQPVNNASVFDETSGNTSTLLSLFEAEDICGDAWLETMNESVHELKINLNSLEKDSYEYVMYFELIKNLENFNSLQQEDVEKVNSAIVTTKNSIEKILEFRGETYE
jgi:hypothetical protein